MAAPMKEAQFDLMFDSGASKLGAIIDYGVELELIEKYGSWYSYQGDRIGQGRDNVKKYLEENPDIVSTIEKAIYEHYGIVDNKDIDPSVMEEMKVTSIEDEISKSSFNNPEINDIV